MSSEDEFELNYVKIDSENDIKLLETEEYAAEISILFSTVMEYDQYKISKKIVKDTEKYIPDNNELLKFNIDFAKKFIKIINSDKRKNFNASVKRLLSIDFRKEFIFNYTNIFDVCSILIFLFSEHKKYKISSMDDLKKMVKKINFLKYDFYRLYLDTNRKKQRNSVSFANKSFTFDYDKRIEINESLDITKTNNFKRLEKNIKRFYTLSNESNNSNSEDFLKTLSRRTFIYPEYNKVGTKDPGLNKTELPVELIILLSKLREVKCLIFQIQNIEKNYKDFALFILSNIDWLFLKGIEEIKFDLSNDNIQQRLDNAYGIITEDLYIKNNINKNQFYYNGNYRARSMNCWIPENDIFFEEKKRRKNDYIYKTQMTEDSVVIDNYICNIYNAFGNLMNIRYIPKINFSINNNFNTDIVGQLPISRSATKFPDELNNSDNLNRGDNSIDCLNESVSIFDLDTQEKFKKPKKSLISKIIENNSQGNNESDIPSVLTNICDIYNEHFTMIMIFSYYINKFLKDLKKLNLFFQSSFSNEIYICYKTDLNLELTHFLIFLNKIETLQEFNCSFNSLDDKSFEYILGILYKNTSLSKLRLSFFTPDINYYDNTLFNLCSSKSIDLTHLFSEFSEYQKKNNKNKEIKINEYILEKRLLNPFLTNLCNLSNLLKLQLLKNLEELVFRFDIPLPLLNNQKYIIVIIKFIINLLIMITFQQNKTKTFKLLAPDLEINSYKMPFIHNFFNEIALNEEEPDNNNEINKNDLIEFNTQGNINEKEQDIIDNKETEIIQKNENKELLRKLSENDKEIFSQFSQENTKEYNIIISEKKLDTNGFNKLISTNSSETAATRKYSSEKNGDINIESRKLNPNDCLEDLVIQMKICFLPEIFNFCVINNLTGLKHINLGNLDEITFKGFVNDYKLNCSKLKSLISIKINLGFSVLSYDYMEKYVIEFININTPKLKEKILLSNLKINSEEKMKELIELVYLKASIDKLVVKINFENLELFSKLFSSFIIQYRDKYLDNINSLILLLQHPKFKSINNEEIFKELYDFIIFSKNRSISCNEYS